jgi:PAS domain S-box-containing protein
MRTEHAYAAKILVVDDDQAIRTLLRHLLTREGYAVHLAENGPRALECAAAEPYDVILLDVMMPNMDGYAVCAHLKAQPATADVPVIFLTGRRDADHTLKGFECGAVDYVIKPFNQAELLARITTHIALRRMQVELDVQNRQLRLEIAERHKIEAHLEDLVGQRTSELEESNRRLRQEIDERIRQEARLRASEQQYLLLADNMADGIGIVQDGRLIFANAAFAELFGGASGDGAAIDLDERLRGHERERLAAWLADADAAAREIQLEARGEADRAIWTEWHPRPIVWQGQPATLCTVRDITASKLRELAIADKSARLAQHNLALRATMHDRYKLGDLVGKSRPMQEVYEFILEASASEANVVIYGESGTGKELVARTIHRLSARRDLPFVAVNCGAIPDTLFESEFFGHRKGAFTGAQRDTQGLFAAAHKGTLFLDEIGELSLAAQVKLLRALQSGEYTRVGDHASQQADARVIAATNKELRALVRAGAMREDFFYRIHVIAINVPPLRARKDDIALLVEHFLVDAANREAAAAVPAKILDALQHYDWPGNIRELQNELQRYLATGRLELAGMQPVAGPALNDSAGQEPAWDSLALREALERFERMLIVKKLDQHHWHRANTARALGLPVRTLHRKMQQLGLI